MTPHLLAVVLVASFFSLAFGVRPALHRLRTGRWGLHGLSGTWRDPGFWGGLSFVASIIVAPVALWLPAHEMGMDAVGASLSVAGLVLTVVAQSNMGRSWRVGVRHDDRTTLVTAGLFAIVRNPIFSGMVLFAFGLVLLWPNWASAMGALLLLVGVELQVRFVEEPFLRSVHGASWQAWARQVGRFMPGVGRID